MEFSWLVQIFGVLDVERVAGNFHISMHGLSLYVASEVFSIIIFHRIFFWNLS